MIDRDGFDEMVARGPLYHLLWNDVTHGQVASVLEHGLERIESNYPGFWESRPGHVYMGASGIVRKMYGKHRSPSRWAVFSVDVTQLERKRVNPDEDHFGSETTKRLFEPARQFRLPFSPAKWTWDWAEYLGIRPPPSLGEWAEAVELGKNPEATRYSLTHGSIAYRGVVPPCALRLVKTDVELEAMRLSV